MREAACCSIFRQLLSKLNSDAFQRHGNRKWSFDAAHTCVPRARNRESRATVVLKLKTSEFKILTRSTPQRSPPPSCEELTNIALSLLQPVGLDRTSGFAWLASA